MVALASVRHDANAIPQNVSLVHEMRREHHDAALARVLKDLPGTATAVRVHAARRLVKEDHAAPADKRNTHGQLAFLAAAQPLGLHVDFFGQADVCDGLHDLVVALFNGHALDVGENAQVLIDRQLGPQHVVLRAHAEVAAHLAELRGDVAPKNVHTAARGRDKARKHTNRSRFAGAIVPQQDVDLASA